jgi:hypothetical protein
LALPVPLEEVSLTAKETDKPAEIQPNSDNRKTVLLTAGITLGSVLGLVVICSGVWFTYDNHKDLKREIAHLHQQNAGLKETATRLRRRNAALGKEADAAEINGMERSFAIGYNAAFDGFGSWTPNSYYYIYVTRGTGKQKYTIQSRGSMEYCRAYQVIGDSVYTFSPPGRC